MWAVAAIVLLLVCGNSYGQEPATHYYNHRYPFTFISSTRVATGFSGDLAATWSEIGEGVYERRELLRIFTDRLEFGQDLCDITVSQFHVLIMPAATDSEICKVRGYHQSNLDAITRWSVDRVLGDPTRRGQKTELTTSLTWLLIHVQRHHRMNFPHRIIFRCPSPV
jgi:hypothetical protein